MHPAVEVPKGSIGLVIVGSPGSIIFSLFPVGLERNEPTR